MSRLLKVRVGRRPGPPAFAGPRIILDSDYGPDVDDLVAHAVLHGLANNDECLIVAGISCISNAKSPGAMNAVDTWHGRGDIPVGGFNGTVSGGQFDGGALFPNGGQGESDGDAWAVSIYDASATYPRTIDTTNYADAVDVYRQALADQPDGSVTICTIGMLNVVAALLQSPADGIDGRTGMALVTAKVDKIVTMGTRNNGGPEFNIRNAPVAAAYVADNSPVPVWWQPFDIGLPIFTGKWTGTEQQGHIVRFGLEAFDFIPGSDGDGRQSWDACTVLAAVRPWETRFTREQGTMTIDSADGKNTWVASGSGPHFKFGKEQSDAAFEAELEPLVFNSQIVP